MKSDAKSYIRFGAVVFIVALLSYYCIKYSIPETVFNALIPIIAGVAFAYLINILVAFYERHFFAKKSFKMRKPLCLIFAILSILIFVGLIGFLVIPQFVTCISTLIEKAPAAIDQLLSIPQIAKLIPENIEETLENIDWNEIITKLTSVLESGLGGAAKGVTNFLSSTVSVIVSFFLGLFFAVCFLFDRDRIISQFKRLVKTASRPKLYKKITYVLKTLDESLHKYIVAQCLEATILGVLCIIGMLILGLPYAVMIGVLMGITALIPIVGSYIGEFVGAFMILSISFKKAIIFLVFVLILQTIESNLIAPHVVGSSIGLPSVWVLAAVTVGGSLMGILGMLIGVPITSTIYKLLRDYTNNKSQKNNDDTHSPHGEDGTGTGRPEKAGEADKGDLASPAVSV